MKLKQSVCYAAANGGWREQVNGWKKRERDEPFVMETRKGLVLCSRRCQRMDHKPSLLSFSDFQNEHERKKNIKI